MTKCNIEKYDKLPGRVGWTDVDYLRFRLHMNLKENEIIIANLERVVKSQKRGKTK